MRVSCYYICRKINGNNVFFRKNNVGTQKLFVFGESRRKKCSVAFCSFCLPHGKNRKFIYVCMYEEKTPVAWMFFYALIVFYSGQRAAGIIISMTNPAHGVLNVSERQCQTSTDQKPRMLLQLSLVPGPRCLV